MPLLQIQPGVKPLPKDINLAGKNVIVTGANAGIGYESTRQLLALNAEVVILGVRNIDKGEEAKKSLLQDETIRGSGRSESSVKVMKLDLAEYASVVDFVSRVQAEVQELHVLILNAAIGNVDLRWASSGHELLLQVNFLSSTLLLLQLLPLLEESARKSGAPSRINWVGSRAMIMSSLRRHPIKGNTIRHFDDPKNFYSFQRYGDTKAIAFMFLRELATRIEPSQVILNTVCPGLVHSRITEVLPFYYRYAMKLFKSFTARPTEEGARIVVFMVAVAGAESHGKFYVNQAEEQTPDFMDTADGLEMKRLVWNDSLSELSQQATLPFEVSEDQQ